MVITGNPLLDLAGLVIGSVLFPTVQKHLPESLGGQPSIDSRNKEVDYQTKLSLARRNDLDNREKNIRNTEIYSQIKKEF